MTAAHESTGCMISIEVSEHNRGISLKTSTRGNILVGLGLKLSPAAANLLYRELLSELSHVIAWRNHPLYQWGQRKIGAI